MTYYPKLLQSVEVIASNNTLGYTLAGAQTRSITVAEYDTMIEVLTNLDTQLAGTFTVTVNYRGIVVIKNTVSWTINWGTTDTGLRDLLGYAGSESVVDEGGGGAGPFSLTATKRHLKGWYSPVPVEYPGIKRRLPRRVQRTEAGGASIITSSTTHKDIDLLFDACLETQLDPLRETTADDGYGGTIDWTDRTYTDWWEDVAARKFRYYEDASEGAVGSPGSEGNEFLTCVRLDEELAFDQVDSGGYTYFSVRLPVAVVG